MAQHVNLAGCFLLHHKPMMHLLALPPAPALAGLLLIAAAAVATLHIARHWR